MSPEELREVLLEFVDLLDTMSLPTSDLYDRITQLTAEEMQVIYDAFPDPVAFAAKVDYLGSIGLSMAKGSALGSDEQNGRRTALGVLGINPSVDPFLANYPSPGGAWFELLGLLGLANDERCDPDFEAGLLTAIEVARIAATVAQAACDTIVVVAGAGTNAPFCVIAAGLNAAADAADFILQQCQVEQAKVDSAEIEATYENSLRIFEGLRCVQVSQARMGHGCNGEDDNCNKQIDECAEDTFSPAVDIETLRLVFRGDVLAFETPVCYDTIAEAEAAVLAVTRADDDCTARKDLVTSVSSAGDPCSLLVTSQAVDDCGNANTDRETVRVDPIAPVVTCAVAVNALWSANHEMIDVGFTFTATDNCTGEPEIEIFVTSDETTASASGAGKTSPAPDAFILRDLDGVYQATLIRAERSSSGNGRVYEITVRATDECGNVGSCSANVSVPPNGSSSAVDDGQFYDATEIN
jgi:hypothetical protein